MLNMLKLTQLSKCKLLIFIDLMLYISFVFCLFVGGDHELDFFQTQHGNGLQPRNLEQNQNLC